MIYVDIDADIVGAGILPIGEESLSLCLIHLTVNDSIKLICHEKLDNNPSFLPYLAGRIGC